MPKGKRKGKYEHRRTEQPSSSDEDMGIDMTTDNMSETSLQSNYGSNHDDAETEAQEKLDDKVLEIVDALGARSNAARAAALTALRAALQRRSFTHVLCSHRATLADHVSKALRRGRDGEKKAAAAVANLLALQIGEDGIEEFVQEVRPALLAAVVDGTASVDTRVECCNALAALCYMLEEDLTEILEVMRAFETIFSGSYLKGDGSARVTGAAVSQCAMHAAALDGWALLLSLLSTEHTRQLLRTTAPGLQRLVQMLAASSVEVRMAAGGALAIAYERMTMDSDADQEADDEIENALPILEELARDSHKYRAKRERKVQRATFRDILKYFEDDSVPVLKVRVGRESVCCDSWSSRAVYGAVCTVLGGALPVLVTNCAVLRAVLNMQDTVPLPPTRTAATRLQRHLQNAAACKARTLVRNKNRDKRSAALAL